MGEFGMDLARGEADEVMPPLGAFDGDVGPGHQPAWQLVDAPVARHVAVAGIGEDPAAVAVEQRDGEGRVVSRGGIFADGLAFHGEGGGAEVGAVDDHRGREEGAPVVEEEELLAGVAFRAELRHRRAALPLVGEDFLAAGVEQGEARLDGRTGDAAQRLKEGGKIAKVFGAVAQGLLDQMVIGEHADLAAQRFDPLEEQISVPGCREFQAFGQAVLHHLALPDEEHAAQSGQQGQGQRQHADQHMTGQGFVARIANEIHVCFSIGLGLGRKKGMVGPLNMFDLC